MQDFEGKTALITGAASGMGFAMAETFAQAGMNIVLSDIEKGALLEAEAKVEAHGVSTLAVPVDVSSEAEMDHLAEVTRERFGVPDLLILNAGVSGGGGPTEELSAKDWQWAIDVNLYGVIHGLRTFLGEMRSRNSGNIVITASVAGLTSFPGSLPYNATKHAVVSIAEGLFSEHAEANLDVGVHCLCPGIVATNITHSERNRPKELMNVGADDAAPAPEMRAYLDQMYANAKPSSEVAELVLGAIVEGRFWIQTDDYFRDAIKARHRAIENDQNPPARGNILGVYL